MLYELVVEFDRINDLPKVEVHKLDVTAVTLKHYMIQGENTLYRTAIRKEELGLIHRYFNDKCFVVYFNDEFDVYELLDEVMRVMEDEIVKLRRELNSFLALHEMAMFCKELM